MAPRDHSGLSLLWKFVPTVESTDQAVHWRWQAFTQSGKLVASSERRFETLTECIQDAKLHGYSSPV